MKLAAFFETKNKPEYTKEEHPIAYLYRLVGFDDKIDSQFSLVFAELFSEVLEKNKRSGTEKYLKNYSTVFKKILAELKTPEKVKDKKSSLVNYYSYCPEMALFGNYVRIGFNDNPWNLKKYLKDLIVHGAKDKNSADTLFNELYEALEVKDVYDKKDQDFFGYLISKEIKEWFPHKNNSQFNDVMYKVKDKLKSQLEGFESNSNKKLLKEAKARLSIIQEINDNPEILEFKKQDLKIVFSNWNTNDLLSPSIKFFDGLKSLIELKPSLTQFQWINLLSGFLRFGITMHELWSCQNRILMQMNLTRLLYKLKLLPADKTHSIIPNLMIGQTYDDSIKNIMLNNLKANDFIKLFLEYFENEKFTEKLADFEIINSTKELEEFYTNVEAIILKLSATDLSAFQKFMKEEMNKKNQFHTADYFSRSDEFFRHTLKDTEDLKDKTNIDKDQYFWLKSIPGKKYRIEPGDGQCLLMTFLTCGKNRSYCSLQELERYLNGYSISMEKNDNSIVSRLMKMGLISDNPDSDHGLTIKNPFPIA